MTEGDFRAVRQFFERKDFPGGLGCLYDLVESSPEDGVAHYVISYLGRSGPWAHFHHVDRDYHREQALHYLPPDSSFQLHAKLWTDIPVDEWSLLLPEPLFHIDLSWQGKHYAAMTILSCKRPCSLLTGPAAGLIDRSAIEGDEGIYYYLAAHVCRHYDFSTNKDSLCYGIWASNGAINPYNVNDLPLPIDPSMADLYYLQALQSTNSQELYEHCKAQIQQNFYIPDFLPRVLRRRA